MSGQVGLSANPPFHASDPNHVIGTLRRKDARHTRQRPPNHGDLQLIRPAHLP